MAVIRRAGAKSPVKKPAPKKTAPKNRAAKPAAKEETKSKRRGVDITPEMRKKMKAVGKRRAAAVQEHKDSVDAVAEVVEEAREAGISMADIADEMGIVRQWLYKIPTMNKRAGIEDKPAGRKPATVKSKPSAPKKSAAPRAKSTTVRSKRTGTPVKIRKK